MITHQRLREVLDYDPETGLFTRRIATANGRHKPGPTGSKNNRFWFLWIDNKQYTAHRVAWFWMTGEWPKHQVDHKNLNGHDNRWENLRAATAAQNSQNRRGRARSGLKGVYYINNPAKCGSKPWRSSIVNAGKVHRLGLFSTPEEAKAAYDAAALRLHGEFARLA